MAEQILSALPEEAKGFHSALSTIIPTDSIKKRPLLVKYLHQYTAPSTSDYFIHKHLGIFLRRELDFYVKNEIINLDEIEDAVSSTTECLTIIVALRKIAHHLIDFLAQLEEFQRKLWLKKKFVVETQYCLTLDRISDKHYGEIAKNQAQHQEWLDLFAIDQLDGYSAPLTVEFLKNNNKLPLDTRFFSESMRDSMISHMDFSQTPVEGTLISSENSQALRLLAKTYRSSLTSIYIDPPYNTNASSIIYKNGYKSSSWLSLMLERIEISQQLLARGGIICIAIDDAQFPELRRTLLDSSLVDLGVAAVRSNPAGRKSSSSLSSSHEYALFFGKDNCAKPSPLPPTKKRLKRYPLKDSKGNYAWAKFVRSGTANLRSDRPKLYYPIVVNEEKIRQVKLLWHPDRGKYGEYEIRDHCLPGDKILYPHEKKNGKVIEKRWERGWERIIAEPDEYRVRREDGGPVIDFKTRIDLKAAPTTWWSENEYASSNHGTKELKQIFGEENFDFPKAVRLVEDCIHVTSGDKKATILDYFAGSGTTPHAVINLNRHDGGRRKYIAVEMGRHFDDVIVPRVKKVIYSQSWKEGKPNWSNDKAQYSSLGHAFKYLRLESYEDALNNLSASSKSALPKEADKALAREYLLKYCLDYETKDSPSLLNIQGFDNPKAYKLKISKPGHSAYSEKTVDLIETFNYLIGLHVEKIESWSGFDCTFTREEEPGLPKDAVTRLIVATKLRQKDNGKWQFRKITGHVLPTPGEASLHKKVLIVWRVLSDDLEEDNVVLDEWFKKNFLDKGPLGFDIVYVNGSSNLTCLRPASASWEVCLIEEHFHKNMWNLDN